MRTERCQPCSLIVALADPAEGDPISRLHSREEVLLTLLILRSWWSGDGRGEGGHGRGREPEAEVQPVHKETLACPYVLARRRQNLLKVQGLSKLSEHVRIFIRYGW